MVDRLLTASHIYLMGVPVVGISGGVSELYSHMMFKNVTLVQNAAAGEIFEQLSQIGPGDVLVGISFPRYSQMAIHAVEYAGTGSRCGGHYRQPDVAPLPHGHGVAAGAQRP